MTQEPREPDPMLAWLFEVLLQFATLLLRLLHRPLCTITLGRADGKAARARRASRTNRRKEYL